MFAFKFFVLIMTLNFLQFIDSSLIDIEKEEESQEVCHKDGDCKDLPKVLLSDGYERFLKIYEEAIKESKSFKEVPEENQSEMLADVLKTRKLLGKPEAELTVDEKELADWVKELEGLSKESLRRTLSAMIAGSLYYSYDPKAKYKPANVEAY